MGFTRRDLMVAAAIPAVALAGSRPLAARSIHSGHPRLFFRREAWGPRGLTVDEVRRRGRSFAEELEVDSRPNPEAAPDWAMSYIVGGDEQAALTAIRHMKRGFQDERAWTTTQGDQIEAIAVAYDWLRGTWPGFGGQDRSEIEAILADGARKAIGNLTSGVSIYHTRMYAWANAALFAGLALYPDHNEAEEFVDFGIRFYKERLIPARRHLGGAWFNALSYGKKYMCRSVFSTLAAWRSATGEDLWEEARLRQGDWAGNMLDYLLYTLRPDHFFASYGDVFSSMWRSNQGTARLVALAVHETGDPYGQSFLREIKQHWDGPVYDRRSRWYQVFETPRVQPRPRRELPLSRLFGRDSIGVAVMRSGWGPEDTWVLFKCGDYGDNHGHFDQGHFEIFRRRELAMDSYYWAKATEHHNTILVSDPEDPEDRGNQRELSRQNHGTLESYLNDPAVSTGDIVDYRETGATTSILGDLTRAYDPAKVERFTRRITFLERRYLIVYDAVTVTDARLRVRFLVHYPRAPEISGRRVLWTNGEGQLHVEVLVPANARIRAVPVTEHGRSAIEIRGKRYWPAGRIEVEAADGDSLTTYFLHVLTPGDRGEPAPSVDFTERSGSFVVRIAGKTLTFGKDGHAFRMDGGEARQAEED